MGYIHDSWCDLDKDGQCDCYVALLEARDKRIAQLEAENERLRELCNDVALGHQNPYDSNYNECDKEPCAWCEEFEALGGE